jgi:prepilin-type N-terminal cleavage/methylation domain-containing protein
LQEGEEVKEEGLTLVELLVVMAVMGIIFSAVTAFYASGIQGWKSGSVQVDLQQHVRIAVDEVVNELNVATWVKVDGEKRIVEYRKKVEGVERGYRFYLLGRQLMHGLPGGTAVPVAGFIDNIEFEPDGVMKAGDMLTFTVTASEQESTFSMRSGVAPRNLR